VESELERSRIDIVDELHKVRRKHATASSKEIEKAATEILEKIEKRRKR